MTLTTHNSIALAVVIGLTIGANAAMADSAADMLPAKYKEAGVLTLATDAKYPPFATIDDSGKIVGFEADLWQAIGEKLGVKVEAQSVAFESLITGVQSGRWDVAMAAITDNPVREEVISFATYGYTLPSAYALQTNAEITDDILSLCGQKGAAQTGTEFLDIITDIIAGQCEAAGKTAPTVSEYGTNDGVILALYSGRTDFVITAAASANEIADKSPNPIRVLTDESFPRVPSGIVFRKDADDLGVALVEAVKEIMADGTYAKIYNAWGIPSMQMTHAPSINQATNGIPD